jgi:hypothetical protein
VRAPAQARRTRRAVAGALALAAALAALAGAAAAAPAAPAGKVTFLAGDATRSVGDAPPERLAVGSAVREGDVLETAARTRLEVRLGDGSALRLGPASRARVERAAFGKAAGGRKVSAKLMAGQVWANVAKAVGGEARFEVSTDHAVAGVRGTTFRVDAARDRSVVVKVYSGTVAVAAGPIPRPAHQAPGAKPERRQIQGPAEVTREEWERIVGAMMQVRVGADGRPGDPEPFALEGSDEWERWNRERDEARDRR